MCHFKHNIIIKKSLKLYFLMESEPKLFLEPVPEPKLFQFFNHWLILVSKYEMGENACKYIFVFQIFRRGGAQMSRLEAQTCQLISDPKFELGGAWEIRAVSADTQKAFSVTY